jgi:hypothetical protein
MADLFRIVCHGSIPRRHEAWAAEVMPGMDPHTRHNLSWAVLRAEDGTEAEALLLPAELRAACARAGTDLSTIPPERVQRRPHQGV